MQKNTRCVNTNYLEAFANMFDRFRYKCTKRIETTEKYKIPCVNKGFDRGRDTYDRYKIDMPTYFGEEC